MVAGSIKEHPEHVFEVCGLKLLKSGVLYGANASGKSNLIKAMAFMKRFILFSQTKTSSTDIIAVTPFLLDAKTRTEPSFFELSLLISGSIYRYGFEINRKEIVHEWLYEKKCAPYSREKLIFKRNLQAVEPQQGIDLSKLRNNALLLSFLDQYNDKHAKQFFAALGNIRIITDTGKLFQKTLQMISNGSMPQQWVQQLLIAADVGIDDFIVIEKEIDWNELNDLINIEINVKNNPGAWKAYTSQVLHKYYNSEKDTIDVETFDLQDAESMGTKLMFGFAEPLYRILTGGGVLIIDEMDKSLHYFLTKVIIELFQKSRSNPHNAQLYFTTHDVAYLEKMSFRRDEIWFAEKNTKNASNLYSLAEFKVRNDASYGKDYLRAKYGAVPYTDFDKFAKLLTDGDE